MDYLLNPRIAQNEMHKQQNMQFMDIDELKILDSSNIPHYSTVDELENHPTVCIMWTQNLATASWGQ